MLWSQGAQNIGLSNHKLKPPLSAPYDYNARPSQTDRWIDRRKNIMAIHPQFLLMNASCTTNWISVLVIYRYSCTERATESFPISY